MKKKTLRDELVTKGHLTDQLADFREGLIDQIEGRMDKKFDKVYISLDKVIKELQTIREEDAAGVLQTGRIQQRVTDHEKRIKKLESAN